MNSFKKTNDVKIQELGFTALDNSAYPVYMANSNAEFVYVNNAACIMLGYGREELLRMNIFDIDMDVLPESWGQVWDSLRSSGYLLLESRHKKKSGDIVDVEISSAYIAGVENEYSISFARDISSKKQHQNLILEREKTYRRLFNSFPLPALTWVREKNNFFLSDYNNAAMSKSEGKISEFKGVSAGVFFEKNSFVSDLMEKCYNEKKTQFTEREYLTRIKGNPSISRVTVVYINSKAVVLFLEDVTQVRKTEKELKTLARFPEDNPNPVFRVDIGRKITYQNRASIWLVSKWMQNGILELPESVCNAIGYVIEKKENISIETRVGERIFHFTISPLEDSEEVYFYCTDITETRAAQQELILAAKVFETTLEGILVSDKDNNVVMVNPAFTAITGYEEAEVAGQNPRILKSDRHDNEFYKKMWEDIEQTGSWEGEIWNRKKNGETYPEWLSINAVKDRKGRIKNYVSVFRDITDVKESEEKIKHQAYHDPLTNLPNRYLFMDRVGQFLSHAKRSGTKAAILFMDIDRFKVVNDSLGHITGDRLLQEIARRLASCIRDDDTVARIGGDEFTILLPEISGASDIFKVLDRIFKNLGKQHLIDGKSFYVTPSIGISVYPDDAETDVDLYKNADIAMYHAKAMGGNSYQFFSQELNKKAEERFALENGLRVALENNEFELYFQPVINHLENNVTGVEALIRWNSPQRGIVPPGSFIPVAEETGIIIDITDWVITRSFEFLKDITKAGFPDLYVSINITSHQFSGGRLAASIESRGEDFSALAGRIIFEITENSIMNNTDYIIKQMRLLKDKGFRFSIDDFGTGYSSLGYLRRFPINFLKIDRSFLNEVPKSPESASIVKTIIALARELGLDVVAEGVENEEQLDFLKGISKSFIQGYYFSKPLQYGPLLDFLKSYYTKL